MEVPHVVVSKFSEEHYDAFISNLHETTQKKYRNNIKDYKMFCTGKGIDFKNECNILTFVTFLRKGDSENGQEERLFAASTLWSMASTVSTYFMYAIGSKPLVKGSRLTNTLKAWSKQDSTKKATAFTKDEVNKFLKDAPNDDRCLVMKVALIISVYGFLRKTEMATFTFDQIKVDNSCIVLDVMRSKATGPIQSSKFVITDDMSQDLVKLYLSKFTEAEKLQKDGRLFRKLQQKAPYKAMALNVIGVNTLAKIPEAIATYLELPVPKTYSSHALRRTAAGIFAESGGSLPMMKIAGGWRSDKVAQTYIDESIHMKKTISMQMAIGAIRERAVEPQEDKVVGSEDRGKRRFIHDTCEVVTDPVPHEKRSPISSVLGGSWNWEGASNCTFNFNIPSSSTSNSEIRQQNVVADKLLLKLPGARVSK